MRTRGVWWIVLCSMSNLVIIFRHTAWTFPTTGYCTWAVAVGSNTATCQRELSRKLEHSKVANFEEKKKIVMHHEILSSLLNYWIKTPLSCILIIILKLNATFWANSRKWLALELSSVSLHLCGTIASQSAWKVYIVKTNSLALYCYLAVAACMFSLVALQTVSSIPGNNSRWFGSTPADLTIICAALNLSNLFPDDMFGHC